MQTSVVRQASYSQPTRRPAAAPAAAAGARAVRLEPSVRERAVAEGLEGIKETAKGLADRAMNYIFGDFRSEKPKTREVLEDASTAGRGEQVSAAREALSQHAAAEEKAIAKLGDRAGAYRDVAKLLTADPVARRALQTMLLDGRLTAEALRGGGDMLTHLKRLTEGELPNKISRRKLISDLIEEAEDPTKIAQGGKSTCALTTGTIYLARKHPAEYVRLVSDMALAGRTVLADGTALERPSDWGAGTREARNDTVRLLQPALMELGNHFMRYDQKTDRHRLDLPFGLSPKIYSGQESLGQDRVYEAMTGESFDMIYLITRFNKAGALERIESALAEGKQVPVGLFWANEGAGGHVVLLEKLEGDWAYYTNPWGKRERMDRAEFVSKLNSAHIPKA